MKTIDDWVKSQNYEVINKYVINPSDSIPYFKKKIPAFFYAINCDCNYAFVPDSYTDYEPLEEMGYKIIKFGYENSNGPFLSANGDLRIYLMMKKNPDIEVTYHYFLIKLMEYLDNYFDDVSISNNDILIDKKKVVGGAMIEYNGMQVFIFQINFVDKENDIRKVCKLKYKQPGFIDPNIVTPEQVRDEFISWLK